MASLDKAQSLQKGTPVAAPNPHPACKSVQFPERGRWSDELCSKMLEEYHAICDEDIKKWNEVEARKWELRAKLETFKQELEALETLQPSEPSPHLPAESKGEANMGTVRNCFVSSGYFL